MRRRNSVGQNKTTTASNDDKSTRPRVLSKAQQENRAHLIQYINNLLTEENDELAEEYIDKLTYDLLEFLTDFKSKNDSYNKLKTLAKRKLKERYNGLITNLVAIIVKVYEEQKNEAISFEPLKQILSSSVDEILFTKVTFNGVSTSSMNERENKVFEILKQNQSFQTEWKNYKKEILERK